VEFPNAASRRRAVWFAGYSEVGPKSAWRRSAVMSWGKVQEGLLLKCAPPSERNGSHQASAAGGTVSAAPKLRNRATTRSEASGA
jgi:hypothetical protein